MNLLNSFGSNRYRLLMLILLFSVAYAWLVKQDTVTTTKTETDSLYRIIYAQDSLMFSAFNTGDIKAFAAFLDSSLEVYQDNKGLRNYEASLEAFKGFVKPGMQVKRTLIQKDMEVFPIRDFGAIQQGSHTFCHPENGTESCGTFRFLHIWKFSDGRWRITRIVTYDHPL